jgi:hypothetical protein
MDTCNPPPNIGRNKRPPTEKTRDDREPLPTHIAYALYRAPDYPPEWQKLGPITKLENGHIMGRFTSTPTSAWGFQWLAVPIGEEPPPLSAEPASARTAQQTRPMPAEPVPESEPLPGEEDEPQDLPGGNDETS